MPDGFGLWQGDDAIRAGSLPPGRPQDLGIRRQRLKGDAWVYKRLVEEVISPFALT